MRSRNKTALELASGLATVFVALQATQVKAEERDPFALPGKDYKVDRASASDTDTLKPAKANQQQAGYVFYADVEINDRKLRGIAKIIKLDGGLAIESAFAFSNGLISKLPSAEFIPLNDIKGITYEFDYDFYRLRIAKELKSTGQNLIDLRRDRGSYSPTSEAVTALILDYDGSLQFDGMGTYAAGLVSPRLVHGDTVLEARLRLSAPRGDKAAESVRLDTALTHRMPDMAASLTLGDFVSQTPAGSRAVRMGGVRFGTDFSTRPDLVTQPLPDFVGGVAVPTGIDVIVNDRRVNSSEVLPGEFTVRSVPVPFGRNEVGVVVRDALGRETVQSVSFYSSRRLLAPELFEGAINVGAIRRRYGVASNDYGAFAISGMARRGISNRLTLTAMGEASSGVVNAGIGADFVIADVAMMSVTARSSLSDDAFGRSRAGHLLAAGIESSGRRFSVSLEGRRVSNDFADIASVNGDQAPSSLLAANINFDLADYGQVQLSAIRQWDRRRQADETYQTNRVDVLSANYRKQLTRRLAFSLDLAGRDHGGRSEFSALLGLTLSIGSREFAQASFSRNQGQDYFQASVSRTAALPGEAGYTSSIGLGAIDRFASSFEMLQQWGRVEVQAEHVNGRNAARINSRGSLIFADGNLFAAHTGQSSFILVDSNGIGDLEVQRENRLAGKTNGDGKLLVGNVPAYNRIKIGVDSAKVPLNVIVKSTAEYGSASPGAVSRVKMQLERYDPIAAQLLDQRGEQFPPGTRMVGLPSGKQYVIGFDSMIELNGALGDTDLKIMNADGSICHADLTDLDLGSRIDGLQGTPTASLRCYMRSKSFVIEQAKKRSSR